VSAAVSVEQKHARLHHRTPERLQAAVHERCVAEFGKIMGFPFDEKIREVIGHNAETSEPWETRAREVYTRLRRAITGARKLAYELPNGVGGSAGRALFHMRGVLPVLPDLDTAPFDDWERPGRAAFVREFEALAQNALGKTMTDRDLAVVSLLWGNCPRGSYKTLLRDKARGMTTAEVIDEEAKYVGRARMTSRSRSQRKGDSP
jgi:hypothetical protein